MPYKITVSRPNTLKKTFSQTIDTRDDLHFFIKQYVGLKMREGWRQHSHAGNNDNGGIIELVHDDVADLVIIQWEIL